MPPRGGQRLIVSIIGAAWSFKSCPREGGNYPDDDGRLPLLCFKSCPREGGNSSSEHVRFTDDQFQVMPPRGGQRCPLPGAAPVASVSSHAPARGATDEYKRIMEDAMSFKSCPREGGNSWLKAACVRAIKFQVMPPRGGQHKG